MLDQKRWTITSTWDLSLPSTTLTRGRPMSRTLPGPSMDLYLYNYYHYYYITIVTIIQAHLWICTTIIYITLLFSNDNGGWIDLFVSGYVCLDFNVKSWLVDLWEWIDMDGYHFCQYVYIWIWVFNVDCWFFDEWYQARIGRPHFCPPGFEFHIE